MEKKILNDFCFHKPKTLEEALVLIDKYQETGLLMEGGSEVIPNMKSLVVTPDHIISLKHIPEFDYLTFAEGEGLHIGPSCILTKVEYDPDVQRVYPSLYEGIHGMSNTNIHNISTVTGNICYAVPSADTAAPLLTLETYRQIGKNAARDLYLSWNDAVHSAMSRYEIVIDRYRSRQRPAHQEPMEQLLNAAGVLMEDLTQLPNLFSPHQEE